MISNGFCDVRCCCLNQSKIFGHRFRRSGSLRCRLFGARNGRGWIATNKTPGGQPPFNQVPFIQAHTMIRLDDLIIYRTAIFGRLIDNPPCFFVAGQSEGNLYIIIHLKNRNPGRGNGEDNLCSFSRVNCVIGDPVRLYFLESPRNIWFHCVSLCRVFLSKE